MRLDITPYIGVGPLRFRMPMDEVRATLGVRFEPFLKSQDSVLPTDAFDDLGIHVYYRSPGICTAVECFAPANPTLFGVPMLGRPYEEVARWMETVDRQVSRDDAGLRAFQTGISLYCPCPLKDPRQPVESVMAFENGYYDLP